MTHNSSKPNFEPRLIVIEPVLEPRLIVINKYRTDEVPIAQVKRNQSQRETKVSVNDYNLEEKDKTDEWSYAYQAAGETKLKNYEVSVYSATGSSGTLQDCEASSSMANVKGELNFEEGEKHSPIGVINEENFVNEEDCFSSVVEVSNNVSEKALHHWGSSKECIQEISVKSHQDKISQNGKPCMQRSDIYKKKAKNSKNTCNKIFTSKGRLRPHSRLHKQQKLVYSCEVCNKSLSSIYSTMHTKKYTQESYRVLPVLYVTNHFHTRIVCSP